MNRLLESILLALAVFAIIGAIGIVTAILFEISVKLGMIVSLGALFFVTVARFYVDLGE